MSTLLELAEADDRIELVVGDLGFGFVEPFVERFPDRFTNAGVAEQNMAGMAAGMAMAGATVFMYSIANFPTLRCLEQLRNDVGYHAANVKVIAVGGGFAYGGLGFSHHATEDLAVLRSTPGFIVAAPGDPIESAAITRAVAAADGPAYVRLGKAGEPQVHAAPLQLPPGSSVEITNQGDVALLTTGGMLPTALRVHGHMAEAGCEVRVISVPWLWPMDERIVREVGRHCRLVATLEEHSIVGGLGSAVAEILAEMVGAAPLLRLGLPRGFATVVGDQEYLRNEYGLSPERVVEQLEQRLQELG